MANIYKGTVELIGNTPLVEVVNIEKDLGLEATLLVKLETPFSPFSSLASYTSNTRMHDFSVFIRIWRILGCLAFIRIPLRKPGIRIEPSSLIVKF